MQPQRLWIDADFGSDPSRAAAVMYAAKHPSIELVGLSISGKKQEHRQEEAQAILKELDTNIPVIRGDEFAPTDITLTEPDTTLVLGPLENIERLAFDETPIGKIVLMRGIFQHVHTRNTTLIVDPIIARDLDAARVVLTQYDITLCPLEVSSQLIIDATREKQIVDQSPFLKFRIEGYKKYLIEKYGLDSSILIFNDLAGIATITNATTLVTERIEFIFQADGSLKPTYDLNQISEPIELVKNQENKPTPIVTHNVIRRINPERILDEFCLLL